MAASKNLEAAVLSAGQARALDPPLSRLLEGLPEGFPLSMDALNRRAAPGEPLDRLNACIIMLSYLRVEPQ